MKKRAEESSLMQAAAKNGRTALHEAAESGSSDIVQLLLSNGASPLAEDKVCFHNLLGFNH